MTLIVLITISASGIIRNDLSFVETANISASARQNALVSLDLALSNLQKSLGPDQRVSATADIRSDNNNLPNPTNGTRQWTGVWGNRNSSSVTSERVFLNWLVSGNEEILISASQSGSDFGRILQPSSDATPNFAPDSLTAGSLTENADPRSNFSFGSAEGRLMVGPGTAGNNSGAAERFVTAPVVSLPNSGAFAYWVGDEGVKAKINALNPWPETTASGSTATRQRIWSFSSAQRVAGELMTGFQDFFLDSLPTESELLRFFFRRDIRHIDSGLPPEIPGDRFHDFTIHSYGVLSNSRHGGLKRDLSRILESGGGISGESDSNFIFPDAGGSIGPSAAPFYSTPPTWGLLRDFARFESQPGTALSPQTPTSTRQGISPVLVYGSMDYTFRVSAPSGGEQTITAYMSPKFFLWNPYNRPIPAGQYEVGFRPPRKGPNKGIVTLNVTFFDTSTGEEVTTPYYFNIASGEFEDTPTQNRNTFRFRLSINRAFSPGETISFGLLNGEFGISYLDGDNILRQRQYADRLNYTNVATIVADTLLVPVGEEVSVSVDLADVGESHMYLAQVGTGEVDPIDAISGTNPNLFQWVGRVEASSNPLQDRNYTSPPRDIESGSGDNPLPMFMVQLFHTNAISNVYRPPLPVRWIAAANSRAYMINRTGLEEGSDSVLLAHPLYFGYTANFWPDAASSGRVPVRVSGGAPAEIAFANDYNNTSFAPNHWPRPTLFDFPSVDKPLFTVADLRHAAVAQHVIHPSYPIGNSLADYRIQNLSATSRNIPTGYLDPVDGAAFGPLAMTHYDLSYQLNEALWDRYIFSTIPSSGSIPDRLPNSRYEIMDRDGTLTASQLRDSEGRNAAAHILVKGAFNINSTSVEAWRSVLGSLNNLEYDPMNPANTSAAPLRNPFSRFRQTTAGSARMAHSGNVINTDDYFRGFRQLTDSELDGLAERIVEQVRLRGPFLSVADFVNRSLTGDDALRLKGALQAAIDDEDFGRTNKIERINFARELNSVTGGGRHLWQLTWGDLYGDFVSSNYNMKAYLGWDSTDKTAFNNPFTRQNHFSPGDVTQADILSAIGSIISARSDTFVIRAFGESDTVGPQNTKAMAWAEVVVQRRPAYFDELMDNPETPVNDLVSSLNRQWGRDFVILSFRWLNPEEV